VADRRIPGAVLSVRRHDRVICERAFGRRRVDQDALLEVDDLFSVASLTKPIVAAGVLQLCEAGPLGLDDEVATYLPEFADPRVLTSYDMATGAIEARAARTPVTIRHLLAHTSGIHHGFVTDDSVMGTLYDRAGVVHDARLPLAENVRRLGPLPLTHEPGAAWTYGLSSEVAGRLIEVASGEALDRYLMRFVFEPLGMRSTFFFVPSGARHRIVGRHRRADGRACAAPTEPYEHEAAAYASGGGGLFTTVQDYARFVQALLDGGRPILGQVSVRNMTSNQIGSLTALGLKYGLGLGLATPDAPGRSPLPVGGFGWYGIFSTWFWALPDRRAIVLLFGNVLEADMNLPLFSRVVDAIERDLAAADPLIVGETP
jgi:CubicO group peptidase (beta-lactamase class C family)